MKTNLIIIPAFNESDSITGVLSDLAAVEPSADVLVVSDGSTDDTALLARAAGAIVVELPFNLGIGGALRTGFRYAVEHGYNAGIQFDADGQHDAREIKGLLAAIDNGADLVIGSRFVDGTTPPYDVGMIRRQAMRFLGFLVYRLVKSRFSDTSSGFRGFSRPMLKYFAANYPVEYMDSVEALVMAINAGFNACEVQANMFERSGGRPSSHGWRLGYYYTRLVVMLLVSYVRPTSRPARALEGDEESDEEYLPPRGPTSSFAELRGEKQA